MADIKLLADHWTQLIAAVGGLGTAAFGLVDASKPILPINNVGFDRIKATVTSLTPGVGAGMSQAAVIETLHSNWVNGTDLSSQKAIAKSLIKLHLSVASAQAVAGAAGVDGNVLQAVATSFATGTPLTQQQADLYARFDLIVTAMLDQTYQKSDHDYRNWTRLFALLFALVLACLAGQIVNVGWGMRILVGLLATPMAPVAKDLASALSASVNAMQLVKK